MASNRFNITFDMTEYWCERFRRIASTHLAETEMASRMLRLNYIKAYEEILKKDLVELFEKYSKNGQLSYTELLKYDKLNEMAEGFKKIAKDLGAEEKYFCDNNFPKLISNVNKQTGAMLSKKFTLIPKERIKFISAYPFSGQEYSDTIWDNKNKLVNKLKTALTRGAIRGQSITDMMQEFKSIMQKEEYICRRIIRTETMHMINASQFETYKNAKIKQLRIINNSGDICDKCMELHKVKVYEIDEAPMLPLHPNCRCNYAPVVDLDTMANNLGVNQTVTQNNVRTYIKVDQDMLEPYSVGPSGGTLSSEDRYYYKRYVATGNSFNLNRTLYSGDYKKIINDLKNNVYDGYSKTMYESIVDEIKNFTRIVSTKTIPYNIKGTRFMQQNFLESVAKQCGFDTDNFKFNDVDYLNKKLAGMEYINEAWTSISFNSEKNVFTDAKIRMDIDVDEGLAGIITQNWSESEFILQRSTKFQILGFELDKDPKGWRADKIIMKVRAYAQEKINDI